MTAQTDDIDITSFTRLSLALEDTASPPLEKIFKDLSFAPQPSMQTGKSWLDLSTLPFLYSLGQVEIESRASGALLRFGDFWLEVDGAAGPLNETDFTTAAVLNAQHLKIGMTSPDTSPGAAQIATTGCKGAAIMTRSLVWAARIPCRARQAMTACGAATARTR